MGKVKVRALGDEAQEKNQKNKAKQKSSEKKLVKGAKGGERVVAVGPSDEELAKIELPKETEGPKETKVKKKDAQKKFKKHIRSNKYLALAKFVDKNKTYSIKEALEILPKLTRNKFDETVELHINTPQVGLSGSVVLPHGTGKEVRIAIANDAVIAEIEKGKINFDVLLANPAMMPKLAKIAKYLGPRGLMPNPKNATLVKDPQKALGNFKKGQVYFKTETKAPIMHLTVGKISFGAKKLSENIEALIDAIKKEKIRNVTLKSTMSPGIKLEL